MNRQTLAIRLVSELARLIVGHPDKLKVESREFDRMATLILEAVASDTGRLVGPGGSMIRTLKLIGTELSETGFALLVNEPTRSAPVVQFKPWNGPVVKRLMEDILKAVYHGQAVVKWETVGVAELVMIELGSGYDMDRVNALSEALHVVFHAIGRAHQRNVRVVIREVVEK
jgi:predicted RNA-binding protein YlqC (UPF0109 family)